MSTARSITLVLLGAEKVGKTALLEHIKDPKRALPEKYQKTYAMDFVTTKVGNQFTQVWDTSGDKRYLAFTQNSFHARADAFLLVFNLTDKSTLDAIPELISQFEKANKPFYLIGTHGSADTHAVSDDAITNFIAANKNIKKCFKTDAKTGLNISEMLETVIKDIPALTERQTILENFKMKHLIRAEYMKHDSKYSDSINAFHAAASKILVNGDSDEKQNAALQKLAHDTFDHRNSKLKRVLLDALVCISIIFGVGVAVLAKHKKKYGTFFHCTAPTDREVEIKNLFRASPAA